MSNLSKKEKRIGEENISNENYIIKIIEYNDANDILVEFQDKYKAKIHTCYVHFKNGSVKNPYHPSVFGIGYYGQGKYKSRINNKKTKSYEIWHAMMERCYDPYFINKNLTYKDCFVCEEWHNFQNFAQWWEEHVYDCKNERMELDKDILFKGNKIYSPETCLIAPQRINILFTKNDVNRGKYPIGVDEYYDKKWGYKKLRVRCLMYNKSKCLGYFPLSKPFYAFYTYKIFKEKYIKQVADEYKDLIPKKLYDALYKYKVEIND